MPKHKYRPPRASRASIAEYWSVRLGLESPLPDDRCWTCNAARIDGELHRCHLVPSGPGSKDNLILLCCRCHISQEGKDPTAALAWVTACQEQQGMVPPPWPWRRLWGKDANAMLAMVNEFCDLSPENATTLTTMLHDLMFALCNPTSHWEEDDE